MNIVNLLFGTYWPQITLVLLGIGYIIKRIFDNKSKRMEIDYTVYRQFKLNAITSFLEAYSLVQTMWLNLNYFEVFEGKLTGKELDEFVWNSLEKMKKSTIDLKIYYEETDYPSFEEITRIMIGINSHFSQSYISQLLGDKINLTKMGNSFVSFRDAELKKANNLLLAFAKEVKNDFLK
jgi:hypothetical protein